MTLLSLIGHVAKEHVIQYSLVMLDDILTKSKDRVKQVHDVALKNDLNIWPILVTLLNRDDAIVMHMASRLITKLATLSRYRCPDSDLIYFLNWLKVQLCSPVSYIQRSCGIGRLNVTVVNAKLYCREMSIFRVWQNVFNY